MGSIPLPALGIKPVEQPDLLGQYARALQLKNQIQNAPLQRQALQQQVTAGEQENQVRAQQLKDQQAMTAAMQQWDGKDFNSLVPLVVKNGASANAVMGLKAKSLEMQKTYSDLAKNDAETGAKNVETQLKKNDLVSGKLSAVMQLPDEQLGQGIASAAQELVQGGLIDPQHAQMAAQLAQMPPAQARQQLDAIRKGYMSDSQMLSEAKSKADIEQSKSTTAKNDAETKLIQQYGGASVEAQQQSDWLKKNPGKGPSDYKLWVMQHSPTAVVMNNQLAGDKNQQALDFAADNYRKTGQLPSGFARSPQTISAIIKRASELDQQAGGSGVALNKVELGANKKSLDKLTQQRDAVMAFENTALKNLDLFMKTAKPAIDSGAPWINRPLRAAAVGMGSQDQAAYNAARQVALTEIAKVVNNPTLAGQLSDTAREEVMGLSPANATLKQVYAIANVLKQDMANRHESYDQQIADIQRRLRVGGSSTSQPAGNSLKITLPSGKQLTIE